MMDIFKLFLVLGIIGIIIGTISGSTFETNFSLILNKSDELNYTVEVEETQHYRRGGGEGTGKIPTPVPSPISTPSPLPTPLITSTPTIIPLIVPPIIDIPIYPEAPERSIWWLIALVIIIGIVLVALFLRQSGYW